MPKAPQFDPAELARTMERLLQGRDKEPLRPVFDPQQASEVAEEAAQGREPEDYRRAFERGGFQFTPASRLPPYSDGTRQRLGLWRHFGLRLAMTEKDVVEWFRSPEDLAVWINNEKLKYKIKQSRTSAPS